VRYLLDTNVVSELKRPSPDPAVRAWYAAVPSESLYLSVVTFGEIRKGIECLRARDRGRADDLVAWLDGLVPAYRDRILPVDRTIADAWGALSAIDDRSAVDAFLAATASVHGLTLVTRNVRDFTSWGVRLLNPFEPLY
jgi:predicted nucleic acid-binding protein